MATATEPPGLIDTDILIDSTRALPAAVQFIAARQAAGILQISIISAMELLVGCRDKSELVETARFLNSASVLPITEAASLTALQLIESYHLSHGLLLPDALIAGSALRIGLRLYTKNRRHFQMIPALIVERPY